jgi:hypothetical protein
MNSIRSFACYLLTIIFNIILRSMSSSSSWWNLRFSWPWMSRSERHFQKCLYQYNKLHRVTFTAIIIFCSGFPTKIWYAFLCSACPRPYPLLLTNEVNIMFAFVGMFVQLVLLEGTPFGRWVACTGTVCRRPGIPVDVARFSAFYLRNSGYCVVQLGH